MQIFFSYGHDKHSKVVKALKDEIEKQSGGEITVWIDERNITEGSHWRERITDGILKSESVVAFLSSYSAREESVCLDELSIALVSKHGMIRTILLESKDSFTPPSRVSEYQWGDMSGYPEIEKQGEKAFAEYIKSEAAKIIKLVTGDDIRQYSEEVEQLRRAFHLPKIDDLTKFDELIKENLVGREWLFNKVEEWENDPDGGNVLMLYGKPGAGKSMFSAHLQMRDASVVAAFPCDCRRSEYSKTSSIILNISYRLALRLPDYRRLVLELLSDSSFDLGSDMLFDRLILNPLSRCTIDGSRAVMVIVVDALDEMDNDELAKFISGSADKLHKYVRFLITSRKEPAITERFSRFPHIDFDETESQTRADLAAYYESRLGEALKGYEDKPRFIERLIDNSGLVFTYARCVCENILADIKSGVFLIYDYPLPNGIDELFRQTLDRSFDSERAEYTMRDYKKSWKIPLGMMLASPEPIPAETLKTLMQWKARDLSDFLEPLSTFIENVNGALMFFHKSFGEWLGSTEAGYGVSREDGISDLADACFDVYSEDPDSLDDYMLLYTTYFLRTSTDRAHKKKYRQIIEDESFTDKIIDKADKLKEQNSFERALKYYQELRKIYDEAFKANPENPGYLHNYSVSLERVAGIYKAKNDLEKALVLYNEALEIDRQLKDKYPENSEYHRGYSVSLEKVAGIYETKNNLEKALVLYNEELEIRRQLKDKCPENPGYLRDYSISLDRVAGIYAAKNDLEKSLVLYKEKLEISKQLKDKYPENPDYLRGYSVSLERVAGINKAKNALEKALVFYNEELEIDRQLKDKYPENPRYLRDYSISLDEVAGIYKAKNDLEKALELYLEALEISRQLKDKYPENPDYLRGYSVSLDKVAGIYEAKNDLEKALVLYNEELEIWRQLKDKYPQNLSYLDGYALSLCKVGIVSDEEQKIKYLSAGYEIAKKHPDLPICSQILKVLGQ